MENPRIDELIQVALFENEAPRKMRRSQSLKSEDLIRPAPPIDVFRPV